MNKLINVENVQEYVKNLSDEDKKVIILNKKQVDAITKAVEEEFVSRVQDGERIEGVHLIENTRDKLNKEGERFIVNELGADAYQTPKTIPLKTAISLIKKKRKEEGCKEKFELDSRYLETTTIKPTLAVTI